MVDRVRVYACWLLDHPQVTPPQLPGGRDLCMECCNAIWVSNRTREVMEQNGPGKLICNVCLRTKFKGIPAKLIEETEAQRKLTDFMREDS